MHYNKIVLIFILSICFNIYNINCGCCGCCGKGNKPNGNTSSEINGEKKNILVDTSLQLVCDTKKHFSNTEEVKPNSKHILGKKKSTTTTVGKEGKKKINNKGTFKAEGYDKNRKDNTKQTANINIKSNNSDIYNKSSFGDKLEDSEKKEKKQNKKMKEEQKEENVKEKKEGKEEGVINDNILHIKSDSIRFNGKNLEEIENYYVKLWAVQEVYINKVKIYECGKNAFDLKYKIDKEFENHPYIIAIVEVKYNGGSVWIVSFLNYSYDKVGLFENNESIIKIKIIESKNITNMSCMFSGCKYLTNLDISNLYTNKVKHMYSMFDRCKSLEKLDLNNLDTRNVKEMNYMFYKCSSLTNLNLTSFNTKNVTNMSNMFYGCFSLTNLNLTSFNTENVTNMSNMFYNCSSLTNLDLSSFNTKNVTNMSNMFNGCNTLTKENIKIFVYQ